ncbi:phage tail sheath family protein [Cryomorpha ignava]|uniref:Phage tail sheath family protein n=1 Tax=Cryomorpha ignava TaxID=101383 RepID=A0A7K3WTJ0_9FLAO|nr:phage tail sheath C-terminal domain-containing protein [Cryomorpha ignava]NEN25007.1 phage tail sheath family protein [Cryomorpha ignava]
MAKYKTPGVYINEISSLPPSVAQVETAIPAFIGYTEKGTNVPTRMRSITEYRNGFGGPFQKEIGKFEINKNRIITAPKIWTTPTYRMFYMLEMFFANGGGDCFIISVGNYDDGKDTVKNQAMIEGLSLLDEEDLPTLIVFPDAASRKNSEEPAELYKAALAQCAKRKDRFLICDVEESKKQTNTISESAIEFRFAIGMNDLKYGAAYFPSLLTTLTYTSADDKIKVMLNDEKHVLRHREESILEDPNKNESSLYHKDDGKYKDLYLEIKKIIDGIKLELPPSAAVAGAYTRVDNSRGVWKAPANVSLNKVMAPTLKINDMEQADLNISSTGKSINAIRSFVGQGVMIWGARTLAGNDNEWRYISVRRFFNMVEKSVKKASERFVFEPNDANTWIKIKAMIENYLNTLWRAGALGGAKPEHAYFVNVGLGQTMTAYDTQEGNLIVEIGLAPVRPAEFINLRFSLKMQKS